MKLTEAQIEKLLSSPIWPSMDEETIQQVIELVESVLEVKE